MITEEPPTVLQNNDNGKYGAGIRLHTSKIYFGGNIKYKSY